MTRRRRTLGALAAAAALAGAAAVATRPGDDAVRPAATAQVDPDAVLAREPYMGVSCRRRGRARCDRVGLAVWLRRPARTVSASIAGRPLRLADPYPSGMLFTGFLEPAGIREHMHVTPRSGEFWYGVDPPAPPPEPRIGHPGGGGPPTRPPGR